MKNLVITLRVSKSVDEEALREQLASIGDVLDIFEDVSEEQVEALNKLIDGKDEP